VLYRKSLGSFLDSIEFCEISFAYLEIMDTIKEIVRDAPFGQIVRYATRNQFFKYPEELPDFEIPCAYTDVEKLPSHTAGAEGTSTRNSISTTPLPSHALPFSPSRLEADLALHTTHSPVHSIAPVKTADGLILAEWYTTTDTANPQNWSQGKKAWTAFLICLYTFIVYAGSSIYVSSTLLVMSEFGVGAFKASLGLALYVLGMLLACDERDDGMGWIADGV